VLRVVLPPVSLARLASVYVPVGVSVKIIVVINVDVAMAPIAIAPRAAGPSTQRKSRRAPRQSHPGIVPRISVRVIGIGGRRSSVNHLRVV
jgi:hypothetical protein